MSLDTPRTRLLGALLRCDRVVHDAHRHQVRGPVPAGTVAELLRVVRELMAAAEMLDDQDNQVAQDAEHWPATGYGLPAWLCTDPAHGATAALDLLTSDDPAWHRSALVDEQGRNPFTDGDLDLFLDVLMRLERLHDPRPPRLLAGRIGEPTTSYVDLAAALLGRRRRALAASTAVDELGPAVRERLSEQWRGSDADRPIAHELLSRLLRVDFPVVHRGGPEAVVLGLEVELAAPTDRRARRGGREVRPMAGGQPAKAFRAGIDAGHRWAIELLESLSLPEPVITAQRSLRYRCVELGDEDGDLDGDSAGLPVALHVVATALDLPRLPFVATGALDDDGALVPLTTPAAQAKAGAVREEGLWSGLTGYFTLPAPHLALPAGGLAQTCARLWPRDWAAALRANQLRQLADLGCDVEIGVGPDPLALRADGQVVGVNGPEHEPVLHHLRHYPDVPVVLSGPVAVGRSWTARSVAADLEREGWTVLVLRFGDLDRPSAAVAGRAAELALQVYGSTDRRHSLLILEDLEALTDFTDLESLLLEIVEVGGCSVLAVALAQRGATLRWRMDHVYTVVMNHDVESMTALAGSLIAAHPERFAVAAGLERRVAEASRGDRWWLVRLLEHAHRSGPDGTTTEGLRRAYLEDRVGEFEESRWSAAELLAACSIVGIEATARQLLPLDAADLRRLGARSRVDRGDLRWLLPSPVARTAILRRRRPKVEQAMLDPLDTVLRQLLDAGDPPAVVHFLTRVGDVYEGALLDRLTGRRHERLVAELLERGDALTVARSLLLLQRLDPAQQRRLARHLADLLANDGWPTTAVGQQVTCLRALRVHEHQTTRPDATSEEVDDVWERVLTTLAEAIRPLIRTMRPEEALGALRELADVRRPARTASLVATLCIHGLDRADPARTADVLVALTMADVTGRLARQDDHRARGRRSARQELTDSPGYRRLIEGRRRGLSAAAYLGRLMLRQQGQEMGLPPPEPAEVAQDLIHLLPRTPLIALTQTLSTLLRHRRTSMAPLRMVRWDEAMAGRLSMEAARTDPEAPLAVAQFLNVLVRLQPRSAERLTYDADGRPDVAFAASLGRRIRATGDRRTLGYTIHAAARVDQELFRGRQGFGEAVVNQTLDLFTSLPGERPQVVLHLIKGLLAVDFERVHVEALLPEFETYVVDALNRPGQTGFEAEIALALAAEDVLTGAFLTTLDTALADGRINRELLLHGMRSGDTAGALKHYHALALALDPSLSLEYEQRRPGLPRLVASLRDHRLPATLDAVAVVSRTLEYAGDEAAGRTILRSIDGTPSGWAGRLLALRRPQEAARVLRVLHDLDAPLARDVVAATERPVGRGRNLDDVFLTGGVETAEALELIAALRAVHPEVADRLAERLDPHQRWRSRLRGLLEIEHPATLGLALRRVGDCGLTLDAAHVEQLESLWSGIVGSMASPWTVGHLIGGMSAVDPAVGRRLATRVSADRLLSRLSHLRAADGGGLAPLIRALDRAGQPELTRSIRDRLAEIPLTALAPGPATELARAALDIELDDDRGALGRRLRDDVLLPALGRRLVHDAHGHLLDIGWLAALTGRLGAGPPVTRWTSLTRLEQPWARLWGETWLAPTPERVQEIGDLLDRIVLPIAPARPWRSAAVLVAAARAGRADEVLARGLDRSTAESSSSRWRDEVDALDATDPA